MQHAWHSENPAAYAKLSCHLPWIAEQYGMSYDAPEDESCSTGTGLQRPYETTCRVNRGSDLTAKEHPCIFPFYYRGKGPYNQCMLFEEENFVYPVFRCPTRNITTKYKEYRDFMNKMNQLAFMDMRQLKKESGCLKPCNYIEYRVNIFC